jgi:hypothetical protein
VRRNDSLTVTSPSTPLCIKSPFSCHFNHLLHRSILFQSSMDSLKHDPFPYCKKALAFAIIKTIMIDFNQIESSFHDLARLLCKASPIALSSVMVGYFTLCPDNLDLLHRSFPKISKDCSNLDKSGQYFAIRTLTISARHCFSNPTDRLADHHCLQIYAKKSSIPLPDRCRCRCRCCDRVPF